MVSLVAQHDSVIYDKIFDVDFNQEKSDVIMLMLNLQVCMLNEKLSDAERMTCDVLRDLLGVKIDMTNVAVQIQEAHS